jgi:hypothetical protein
MGGMIIETITCTRYGGSKLTRNGKTKTGKQLSGAMPAAVTAR